MPSIIYRASQRGVGELGWLHARFSFSFAEYHNPQRMGFGALRVINNDIIEPAKGFGMHPHRDMEIITIILKGSLEHRDSSENHGVINEGEIQYMSAGSGIQHSEYNPSKTQTTELFQIWIHPNERGGKPLFEQRDFNNIEQSNTWAVIVSPDGREHSIKIKQEAFLYTTKLDEGKDIALPTPNHANAHLLYVIEGSILVEGEVLDKRDEIQLKDIKHCTIKALSKAHIMLFEVPI